MIWIRADANSEIGTGHIMRCLSIAAELKKQGQEVCFVLADEAPVKLLQEKEQSYLILQTDYRMMEEELEVLLPLVVAQKPEMLIVDSYYVTEQYLRRLGEMMKVAYIDDKVMFPYPVHILINYNVYGERELYGKQQDTKCFLMGMEYAPLRQEFQNVMYHVRPQVENVLITTGGSDKYNLAGKILQRVLADERVNKLHYHVVSGMFNSHLPTLEALAGEYSNVHIHKNVSRMSELMVQCDVAVSAAGSTMYELCAVGVPIICFAFVDNQEAMVESFVKKGIVCYGGNYLKEQDKMIDDIAENIWKMKEDAQARRRISETERRQVDGRGAARIAEMLCSLM